MEEKNAQYDDFESLINRMHNCGDLEVLKKYITLLRNECKIRRYDPNVIIVPQALAMVNGEESSYDYMLDQIEAIVESD
jgi:hypothetical protein